MKMLRSWSIGKLHIPHAPKTQRIQAGSDSKASSLRAGFHRTRSCYASFQGRKAASSPTQQSHNNDQHGPKISKV